MAKNAVFCLVRLSLNYGVVDWQAKSSFALFIFIRQQNSLLKFSIKLRLHIKEYLFGLYGFSFLYLKI